MCRYGKIFFNNPEISTHIEKSTNTSLYLFRKKKEFPKLMQ